MKLFSKSLIANLIITFLTGCGGGTSSEIQVKKEAVQATEFTRGPPCDLNQAFQKINIVHVADLHSRYHASDNYLINDGGNYAKIKAYHNNIKKSNAHTLFTNGGDDYEKGSIAEELSKGASTREIVHAMGFDIRVIGNHDFAWGEEEFLAFSKDPYGATLMSNVTYTGPEKSKLGTIPFAKFQVGCIRIGALSMVGEAWDEFDDEQEVNHLENFISDYDLVDATQKLIDTHKKDVDFIILFSHLRFDQDQKIAKNVNGLHLILGAHTHRGYKLWKNNEMLFSEERYKELRDDLNSKKAALPFPTSLAPATVLKEISDLEYQMDRERILLTERHTFTTDLLKPLIIQTGIYGQALASIVLKFNALEKSIKEIETQNIETSNLTDFDEILNSKIKTTLTKYIPKNATPLGFIEDGYSVGCIGLNSVCDTSNSNESLADQELKIKKSIGNHVVQLAGDAAMRLPGVQAALLNPNVSNPYNRVLRAGALTSLQELYRTYMVERQPSNTPGYNAMYQLSVTGKQLKIMKGNQPYWLYRGPADIIDTDTYKVVVHKAAALNPADARNFGPDFGLLQESAKFIEETWKIIYDYTNKINCQYLDTKATLPECSPYNGMNIWQFDKISYPMTARLGNGSIQYYDPQATNWATMSASKGEMGIASPEFYSIDPLSGPARSVLKLKSHSKQEGFMLEHDSSPNGDFTPDGLVSSYTFIFDIYFPETSLPPVALEDFNLFSADTLNANLPIIRIANSNGSPAVVFNDYIGYKKIPLQPKKWQRLAFTIDAKLTEFRAKIYIDGKLVEDTTENCAKTGTGNEAPTPQSCKRFAIGKQILLFGSSTSRRNNYSAYLANAMFVGRPLTAYEIGTIGVAHSYLQAPQKLGTAP